MSGNAHSISAALRGPQEYWFLGVSFVHFLWDSLPWSLSWSGLHLLLEILLLFLQPCILDVIDRPTLLSHISDHSPQMSLLNEAQIFNLDKGPPCPFLNLPSYPLLLLTCWGFWFPLVLSPQWPFPTLLYMLNSPHNSRPSSSMRVSFLNISPNSPQSLKISCFWIPT